MRWCRWADARARRPQSRVGVGKPKGPDQSKKGLPNLCLPGDGQMLGSHRSFGDAVRVSCQCTTNVSGECQDISRACSAITSPGATTVAQRPSRPFTSAPPRRHVLRALDIEPNESGSMIVSAFGREVPAATSSGTVCSCVMANPSLEPGSRRMSAGEAARWRACEPWGGECGAVSNATERRAA